MRGRFSCYEIHSLGLRGFFLGQPLHICWTSATIGIEMISDIKETAFNYIGLHEGENNSLFNLVSSLLIAA